MIDIQYNVIDSIMNTQQKTSILKKFINELNTFQDQVKKNKTYVQPSDFDSYKAPEIDIVSDLIVHQKQINTVVDQTYSSVQGVLHELSQLQTRKENINKLLDSMTAIKEAKRLSYGLGTNPQEIYKNLVTYYQIKQKIFYCDKYIEKVEDEIIKVRNNFQHQFQQQLKKSNSDNITEIAKALNLIAQNSKSDQKLNTHDHLAKFYVELVKKQLKTYEDDLFKIPIVGTNTSGSYIFFDIAKQVMKLIVQTVTNYKGNIIKIGGQDSLQKVIIQIFGFIMNGIILQIFMREKKYFDVDSMDAKKINKEPAKFKDYYNQFCAIWNQIERLRAHLASQIPSFSPLHKSFQNSLSNCTNSAELIKINSQTIEGSKAYTRFLFNKLLKSSPFVNSIWQLDYDFLNNISDSFTKGNKQLFQSSEGHDFLIQTFSILSKSLQKAFETLNMLIISPMISFANNNLIQQDSFHAFTQLFTRIISRMPSGESKHYTAIVVLTNNIMLMPNALRTEMKTFVIPNELQNYKMRLQSQLKQLSEVCEYKAKQVINSFIETIVTSPWFVTQLKQDYKKTIQKWKGFAHQINQSFLMKVSQRHSKIMIEQEFSLKGPKKLLTQQAVISLQKQIRNIVIFYQVKGCSALSSFKKVLQYIQIMLAQNDDSANKLMTKFGIQDAEEVDKIKLLRAMKAN